ncbi:MAG TPA: hypothetical protein VLL72_12340, partial [Kiloniellales bacterium]|nr:hypothetical protein [Kiloniellales bacterium]
MAISRRGIAAVVCAALVLPGCESLAQDEPPAAGETARGVVFEDLNGNAARDPGEPGIPGVAVSNGRAVV